MKRKEGVSLQWFWQGCSDNENKEAGLTPEISRFAEEQPRTQPKLAGIYLLVERIIKPLPHSSKSIIEGGIKQDRTTNNVLLIEEQTANYEEEKR